MPKGRPKHGEWRNFHEIRDEAGKLVGAQCHLCSEKLAGHSSKALASHRNACLKRRAMLGQQSNNNSVLVNCLPVDDVDNTASSLITLNVHQSPAGVNTFSESRRPVNVFKSPSSNGALNNTAGEESDGNIGNVSSQSKETLTVDTTSSVSAMERNVKILKFFLKNLLDLHSINCDSTIELVHSFDSNHILPSVEELKSDILKHALDSHMSNNWNKQYYKSIEVISVHQDLRVVCLSFLHACDDKPSFLQFSILPNTDTIQREFLKFCASSFLRAKGLYKEVAYFLIHDGSIAVPQIVTCKSNDTNLKIRTATNLIAAIDKIKAQISQELMTESDFSRFCKSLDTLRSGFQEDVLPLSVATEKLWEFTTTDPAFSDTSIGPVLLSTFVKEIDPICIASNYFDPTYHGERFKRHKDVVDSFDRFINSTAPPEAFDSIGAYISKSQEFSNVFFSNIGNDKKKFWSRVTKIDNVMSDYGFTLSGLKAAHTKYHTNKLINALEKYSTDCELSHKFESYIFSLFFT